MSMYLFSSKVIISKISNRLNILSGRSAIRSYNKQITVLLLTSNSRGLLVGLYLVLHLILALPKEYTCSLWI